MLTSVGLERVRRLAQLLQRRCRHRQSVPASRPRAPSIGRSQKHDLRSAVEFEVLVQSVGVERVRRHVRGERSLLFRALCRHTNRPQHGQMPRHAGVLVEFMFGGRQGMHESCVISNRFSSAPATDPTPESSASCSHRAPRFAAIAAPPTDSQSPSASVVATRRGPRQSVR